MRIKTYLSIAFLWVSSFILAQNYEAQMFITASFHAPQSIHQPESAAQAIPNLHIFMRLVPITEANKRNPMRAIEPPADIYLGDVLFTDGTNTTAIKDSLLNQYKALQQWGKKENYTITTLRIEVAADTHNIVPGRSISDSIKETIELTGLNEDQIDNALYTVAKEILQFTKEIDAFLSIATIAQRLNAPPTAEDTYQADFFIEISNELDQLTMQIAISPHKLTDYQIKHLDQVTRYTELAKEIVLPDQPKPLVITQATSVHDIETWLSGCYQKLWLNAIHGKIFTSAYFEGHYHAYLKTTARSSHDYRPAPRMWNSLPDPRKGEIWRIINFNEYAQELLAYINDLRKGMYSGPSPFGKESKEPSVLSNKLTRALTDLQTTLQTLSQKLAH